MRSAWALPVGIALAVLFLTPVGAELGLSPTRVGFDMTQLGGNFLSLYPGATMTGRPSSTQSIAIGVTLGPSNASELQGLSEAVSTPGSTSYRHFLSAAQVESRFAPSPSRYRAVESYFAGYGLKVVASENRLILGVDGTPAEIGAAFHTTFGEYRVPGLGGSYYGPTTPPLTPTSLGLTAATGFTNAASPRPASIHPIVGIPSTASGCPTSFSTDTGPVTTYTPGEIEAAYGFSDLLAAGNNGKGETIGLVDVYDSAEPQDALTSDLDTYSSDCSLESPSINYEYPESFYTDYNSSSSSGWGGEETLDMDWAHAVAPGATIDMSFALDSENVWLYIAVDYLVTQDIVNAISMSWGAPDLYEQETGDYALGHAIFEAAAAEGISVFSSSGDCGAAAGTTSVSTLYPASDEYVTGVGATNLTLASGAYGGETAWSGNGSTACNGNNTGGSGGGWAPTPQPWYQQGEGVASKGLRGVPDVALDGGAGSPLDVVAGGNWAAEWGTSAASPQWAGVAALVDQEIGGNAGLLNPAIYSILRSSSYASYFHDITVGNNGYAAHPGWNPIAGVGTPIANALVPVLANGAYLTGGGALSVSLSETCAAPPTCNFAASATGGAGSYLYSFNFGDGNGTTTTTPSASWTYQYDGVYFPDVVVFDKTGNSSISPFEVASIGTSSLTPTLDASATSVEVGQAVTFTATPGSEGTSPYFYDFYFGDGSSTGLISDLAGTAYSATAESHVYAQPGTYLAQVIQVDSATTFDGGVSSTVQVTVTANPDLPPSISSFSVSPNPVLPDQEIFLNVTATDGTSPYSYTYSGLPSGCSTSNTATLTCTPSTAGVYDISVLVTDSSDRTATRSSVLTVGSTSTPLTITEFAAFPGTVNVSQSTTFVVVAAGGTGAYTYAYSGLPPGCSNESGAQFSCSPSASGTYTVTVTVTDTADHTATASLTLTVNAPAPPGNEDTLLVIGVILAALGVAAIVVILSSRNRSNRNARSAPPPPPAGVPMASPGWAGVASPAPPYAPAPSPPSFEGGGGMTPPPPSPVAYPSPPAPVHPGPTAGTFPRFCRHCGAELQFGSSFCRMCGQAIERLA